MSEAKHLTTTISTKGQVILPKAVRERRGWPTGTRLTVEDTADGVLLRAAVAFAPTRSEDVFASLPWRDRPKTLEEIEAGIGMEIERRHAGDRY